MAEYQLPSFDLDDPRAAFRQVARRYLDFALENPALYELMFQQLEPAKEQPERHPHATALLEAWQRLYDRGLREGIFRIPERDVAMAFYVSLVHGFAQLAIARRMPQPGSARSLSQTRDRLVDELLHTMTHP
jgi:AcrR family transcriptional regulator